MKIINAIPTYVIGRIRTVVSISHCGCDDPGSIPGFDNFAFWLFWEPPCASADDIGAVVMFYFMVRIVIGCSYLEYCLCDA